MPFCSQCGTENPDVAKFCFACGNALVAPAPPPEAREVRKVVTIVFSDLKGSTAMGEKLDSESLREVMTRYFDAMSAELERHGGVVEKFIGDAIMAVFGLPTVHEDDALRAVRAAADMQRAQAVLNDELERHWGVRLTVRTGVNTGQVVAGDPAAGQRLVTGDAVNVAARLEQAAGAQEVLLGDLTYRLVRDYIDVEEVEPLELKGKAERVPAYRLVGVHEDSERPKRLDSPLVGRGGELAELRAALDAAISGHRGELVTIVGEAGVGKSRLIDEFIRSAEAEVAVLRGRCLAYGDGITFWPLAEAVRGAARIAEVDSIETASSKLAALVDDEEVRARVESAIGLSATSYPVTELVWATRKLLERLAAERPVLVLFDDIHWAEPTFLDLVEQVVAGTSEAPLLLVCTTRHELIERLPDWSSGAGARRIVLELLSDEDTAAVAEHLLGMADLDEQIRERIVAAAEGNPLFVEQLLSMLIDEGMIVFEDGAWHATPAIADAAVPPTIHALLAARLDGLGGDERAVIEPASVIGQVFVRAAVQHLSPERVQPELDVHLHSLAEKQLVHTDHSRTEENAFRFHHVLIRDTAYDAILKRARATFHEQFVEWADSVNREGATEYEEILGYHLEQAHRYLSELGPLDEHGRALGADGSRRLAAAGRRAFARGDAPAAANLLQRAHALLPDDVEGRLELLAESGEAMLQAGRFGEAEDALGEAIARGEATGARRVVAHASLMSLIVQLRTGDSEGWHDRAAATAAEAMAVFEEIGDHAGLARGWRLLAWTHGTSLQYGMAAETSANALEHARLAGDARLLTQSAMEYAAAAALGSTPVAEAIERSEQVLLQVSGDRHAEAVIRAILGSLLACHGSFDRARELASQSLATLEDLRLDIAFARMCLESWRVEMLAGELLAAERVLRDAYDRLQSLGERYLLSTVSGLLGQTVYELGRFEEAESLGLECKELATEDDIDTQTLWRCLLGKVVARKGSPGEGERLILEAIEMLAPTDDLPFQCAALLDLAAVQEITGSSGRTSTLERARDLARAKGNLVRAEQIQRMLDAIPQERVRVDALPTQGG